MADHEACSVFGKLAASMIFHGKFLGKIKNKGPSRVEVMSTSSLIRQVINSWTLLGGEKKYVSKRKDRVGCKAIRVGDTIWPGARSKEPSSHWTSHHFA